MQEDLIIYKEDYEVIKTVLDRLVRNTKAEIAFITDIEGHCIAATGKQDESELNSISSLIAGSVAAVESIAQMLHTSRFSNILTESEDKNLYISDINRKIMLIVVFGRGSNLGLVRLRVKNAREELFAIFEEINRKIEKEMYEQESPFNSVSDEEIDEIFGD
jgi:predicted regulator of Ras-like GTPase activity (Roadblock/LC7/MglB family)